MNLELIKSFNCSEYYEDYYKNGLFHPTEAQLLYAHNQILIDNTKQYIEIGGVYDDFDMTVCYRKEISGVWCRSNRYESYQLISETLKEFV
jgi:hypothetical protein